MKKQMQQKKSDYFCKSLRKITHDSIKNNWLALMMDVMKRAQQWHGGSGNGNGNGWRGI